MKIYGSNLSNKTENCHINLLVITKQHECVPFEVFGEEKLFCVIKMTQNNVRCKIESNKENYYLIFANTNKWCNKYMKGVPSFE